MSLTDQGQVVALPALGPAGEYTALRPEPITDFTGRHVADLSLVPAPFVTRATSRLRAATPLSRDERIAALHRAAQIFTEATIAGLDIDGYIRTVSSVSGMGVSVVREAVEHVAEGCRTAMTRAESAMPTGAVPALDGDRGGRAAWMRRAEVLGVLAAGNHPAVHTHWLEALALGYRIAVRPSRREPFTPHRLVSALRAAGFPDDHVVVLPTDHDVADTVLRTSDLAIVYGGDDVVAKYRDDPSVYPQGPGRSKIVIADDVDWRDHVDVILQSVVGGGGVGCTNTTSIYIDGDPAPLAHALAERLDAFPKLPPLDDAALLPTVDAALAGLLAERIEALGAGATRVGGAGAAVTAMEATGAIVTPAVHIVPGSDAAQLQVELPFAAVWITAWQPSQGFEVLGSTLALSLFTTRDDLVDEALAQQGIRSVFVNEHGTNWGAVGVPHDGYLGEFLMTSKGYARRH